VVFPEYYDGTAYDWNVTITGLGPGSWDIASSTTYGSLVDAGNILLLIQGNLGPRKDRGWFDMNQYLAATKEGANITAISLKPTSKGQMLWTKHYDVAPGFLERRIATWDPKVGVFVTIDSETMEFYGWSLADGSRLWGPVASSNAYDYFTHAGGGGEGTASAYGKLYYSGYGGTLYCWDMLAGNLDWTYGNGGVPGNSTFDVQQSWGNRPIFISTIADGKIYLMSTEHSPNTPLYKDALVRSVNATTGEEVWTLTGWGTGMASTAGSIAADGFLVYLNCYDMQIYSIGKGPSAMTVEAPMTGFTLGSSLVIRGTVTDIAAGTRQKEQAARFPNGVPAVSDESMKKWMEYVYMQKPKPKDANGVPVTIDVVDSNGNYRNIGTATSDTSGMFTFSWTPDIEGDYKVIATFAGSESYWPSSAETSFVVDPAPPEPVVNEPEPPSMADTYLLPGIAIIIIAIAIVGALILLILRKRP
jgi:hypothetical protein